MKLELLKKVIFDRLCKQKEDLGHPKKRSECLSLGWRVTKSNGLKAKIETNIQDDRRFKIYRLHSLFLNFIHFIKKD